LKSSVGICSQSSDKKETQEKRKDYLHKYRTFGIKSP